MKSMRRTILVLTLLILGLSVFCSFVGLLSSSGATPYNFVAITKETVSIYGKGLYALDSVSIVAQGLASDFITLIIAVPVTLIALFYSYRNSFKAELVLTGMLGYFLYTYMSYVFLWNYNVLFIVYVAIMSLSFYGFIIMMTSFDLTSIKDHFIDPLKTKSIIGFQLFVAIMVGMLWLSKLTPSWFNAATPVGLEHYTTLVIQAMDLGFIVPTTIISAILLYQRKPLGYLLSSVILIKGIALLSSITAMAINMMISGVETSIIEIAIFGLLDLFGVYALWRLLVQIKKPSLQNTNNTK